MEYKNRKEVPEKYKWDLTDYFKDETEFQKSFSETEILIEELNNYVGCTKEPSKLYEYLCKYIKAIALWEDLYVYSFLIVDQELGVSESIERKDKTLIMNKNLSKNTSFFAPELLKLSDKEYSLLFETEPKLLEFKKMLDETYKMKEHILDEEQEKIISELVSTTNKYSDISSTLLNSEIDYGKIKLDNDKTTIISTNNYRLLMKNPNQEIRKEIYNSFNKSLEQHASTFASLLNGYVSLNISDAKLHRYNSSWDRKLFDLELENEVFETLIDVIENNLKTLQKYNILKKDVLGLNKIHGYDTYLELVETDIKYTVEEAQDIVRNSLKPLGDDYLEKYEKIIKNRYIDYSQYKGKWSGGYSASTLQKDSRILMSYNDDLLSVSTIAHEAGHNVHHQFINQNNPLQYRDVGSLVAEVTSLTNECLLSDYILKNGRTKDEKLSGIYNILAVITSNLYGAVREGKMEQDMYEHVLNDGTLTDEFLGKLAYNSLKKYHGDTIELDKYSNNNWITRAHYYMNFYMYSYAICICVACSVASEILNGNKEMLMKYYEFLKAGSDKTPSEAFEILGVNLKDKKVYENAIKYFDSLIDKYYEVWSGKEN